MEDLQAKFIDAKMGKPTNSAAAELLTFCGFQKDILTVNGSRGRWWFPLAMKKAEAEAVLEAKPDF